MSYTILTTIMVYKDGKGKSTELPFTKTFTTAKKAEEYGNRFFEPPGIVLAWRVVENEKRWRERNR